MAYIGNTPAENYASFLTETFTVSATANYTLSHAVSNENDIRLVINGVVQQPGSGKAYTASGTTLTLTSATVSGDSMYAVYLGRALQTINPPNASVGTAQLADSSVTSAKLGTGATNTPAFEASLSAHQSIADNGNDKVQFNIEILDTDNCYDNSTNYRFTPNVAGKYYVALSTTIDDGAGALRQAICRIYKNGSSIAISKLNFDRSSANNEGEGGTPVCITIVDMNGSSDYLEGFVEVDTNDGGTCNIQGHENERTSRFSAYKLIGV